MRIFLSSTAHDLGDLRAFTVNLLEKRGHEVLFHESPTFPARVGLHSHDQCIEAVADSNLVICLIDRRYGGRYAGARIADITQQEFDVQGYTRRGKRQKFRVQVQAKDLSITWIELITAHKKGIPIVTFARQRTLDEKETRRCNQFLSSFAPAYAEKNELFDFLDWITKQKINNWIAPFISIVDFEQKLSTWMGELERSIAAPKPDDPVGVAERTRVCVIVEGETDRLFVSYLVQKLELTLQFVIIPMYGKYNVLNNFKTVVAQYAKIFAQVVVLLDSDAETDTMLEQNRRQLQAMIADSGADNLVSFFAHPSIEAWISAGLDDAATGPELVTKQIFDRRFGPVSLNHLRNLLLHKFSYDRAMKRSRDFRDFVEYLLRLGMHDQADAPQQ